MVVIKLCTLMYLYLLKYDMIVLKWMYFHVLVFSKIWHGCNKIMHFDVLVFSKIWHGWTKIMYFNVLVFSKI